jgi:type II secretory pathway component GspD/PulD (secretin)
MGTNVDVRAILRALASRTTVKVLSTPRILALNNEEARILVGSEVPFTQSTRAGLDVIVDQTVQFRNVGTQLTIVPTVNNDRYVTFRILQEVSALTAQTIEAALNAPVISSREVETSAIVRSGSTIIIGGLIDESEQRIQSGIPFLQDLPILGALFRNTSTSRSRSELAIFVTPHVVFDDAQADSLLQQQRGKLRSMQPTLDSIFAPEPVDTVRAVSGEKAMTGSSHLAGPDGDQRRPSNGCHQSAGPASLAQVLGAALPASPDDHGFGADGGRRGTGGPDGDR